MSEVISPFGADNLPLKELKKQSQLKKEPLSHKKNKILIGTLSGVIFFLLIIILLLLLKRPQAPLSPSLPSSSPVLFSPSPTSTEAALPKSLPEKLESLEEQLQEVDFYQPQLSFPILDFNLNFGEKK